MGSVVESKVFRACWKSCSRNRREACIDARNRHTIEVANFTGFPIYAPGTMDECRRERIILPL
jgi:hypothetical protein